MSIDHLVYYVKSHLEEGTDPMGRELYWFTVVPIQGAVENGWVSLTLLRVDFTDDTELAKLAAASVEAGSQRKISAEPTRNYRSTAWPETEAFKPLVLAICLFVCRVLARVG